MTLSLSLFTFCRPNSLFPFYSLQHHVLIRHRRNYGEQKAVVVVKHHYQGCQLNAKRASTRKCLRGLSNLYSSAAYDKGRLTLIFNAVSYGLHSTAAYNQGRLTIE